TTGERLRDPVGLDDAAPRLPHRDDLGSATLGELDEEEPEAPALADDDAIARLHQGGDRGFEPSAPGARDREREFILRLEDKARERHHLAHHRGELGIELAEEPSRHGAQDTRVGRGRPGAEENPGAWQEIAGHEAPIIAGLSPRTRRDSALRKPPPLRRRPALPVSHDPWRRGWRLTSRAPEQ